MIKTISISKTKKITARRKNRVEKGIRAEFLGSKPHSKGELFSRLKKPRKYNIIPKLKIAILIKKLKKTHIITINIHKK